MTTPKDHLNTHLLAALSLFVLTLAAFAVVWPLNTAAVDDWVYFYVGLPGILSSTAAYAVRPYAFSGAVLANQLMPGQAQNIYVVHVFCLFIAAFCLYHITQSLIPGHTWFAFLVGAVYLFYIPFNGAQVIPLHFEVYSWAIAAASLGFALYVQSTQTRGWLSPALLVLAALSGYVAVLSYESTFPVLIAAPIVVWLAKRKWSLRFWASTLIWWGTTLIAFLQFLIPFLHGDPSTWYQNKFERTRSISDFIANTSKFYNQSFPIQKIYHDLLALPSSPHLGTALVIGLIAAISMAMFWRRNPAEHHLPSPQVLLGIAVVGLVLNGLAGASYIYANYVVVQAHFFAAPAQALVVSSIFGICAWLLRRSALAPLEVSLFAFVIVFFALGSYWYHNHQVEAITDADFSRRRPLFQSMLALMPDVVEGTLVVYDCSTDDPIYTFRQADAYAVRYLYEDRANLQAATDVHFEADTMTLNSGYGSLVGPPLPNRYSYDQLIILRCTPEGLRIVDTFPSRWASGNKPYNPYARIVNRFIQPRQASILAR